MLNRLHLKAALFPVLYIYKCIYTISHTYNYIIVYYCTFYFPVTEIFMIFNIFLLLCPSCQSFQQLSILITKVASHQCSGRSFSCPGSLLKALGFKGKKFVLYMSVVLLSINLLSQQVLLLPFDKKLLITRESFAHCWFITVLKVLCWAAVMFVYSCPFLQMADL